ncbi:hypothetical protein F5B20DRAFT_246750 [Whalleya microplaca]|nr:hypothetical protein F5B20DRAFT_246750 [Whalleya microplaca]
MVRWHPHILDNGHVDVRVDYALSRTLCRFVSVIIFNTKWSSVPTPINYTGASPAEPIPTPCNIVTQVVDSRADIQTVAVFECELQAAGHRVCLAMHDAYEDFALKTALGVYPIRGDLDKLVAFMA